MDRAVHRSRRVLLGVLALYSLLGLLWLGRNLGAAPGYGDSREYVARAATLEVDAYRGVAYPLFLAAIDRIDPGPSLEEVMNAQWSEDPQARSGSIPIELLAIQLVQLALWAASLAYFLRVLLPPLASGSSGLDSLGSRLLFLLLFADPLLAHYQLALLTDGPALSFSLVFCAALASYVLGRGSRRVSGTLLFLSALLAPSLRVEKVWVLAGTVLGALACWLFLARKRSADSRRVPRSRALQAAGIALAGVVVNLAVHRSFRGEDPLPVGEFLLLHRVNYPNVSAVYDQLPEDIRSRLSWNQARFHDSGIVQARTVIDRVTGGDPALRRSLVEGIAGVVLRERWPWILLDVFRDAAENFAAPLSFYGRLGFFAWVGPEEHVRLARRDHWTRWTYKQISLYHPLATPLLLCASGLVSLLCALLALTQLRSRATAGPARSEPSAWLAWLPIGLFALANAFAFALASDLVMARYAIFAHAAWLALAYRGALGWAAGGQDRASLA